MNQIILRLPFLIFLICKGTAFAQSSMEKMINGVAQEQKVQHIKSSNTEFLSGRITINISEITYHNPDKKGKRRCEQKNTSIATSFYGRVSQHRIKLYMNSPKRRMECESETHCPVFDGSSKYVLKRDPNTMKITEIKEYPLQVTTKYIEQDWKWMKEKEQYVVCASQQTSGANTLEGLNIEIKPYKPATNSDGATLIPLIPTYVLWITGGRDWKQAEEPKKNGINLRWDDIKEKLMPVNEAVSLGIPYEINIPSIPERDGENYYGQLLLNDVKGFDEFLLNPLKAYSITAMATRYRKNDYYESRTTITVRISLGADVELPPLKPVDDIDLTPLEPLGEEIPLTPTESVK